MTIKLLVSRFRFFAIRLALTSFATFGPPAFAGDAANLLKPICIRDLTPEQLRVAAEAGIRDFQRQWRTDTDGRQIDTEEADLLRVIYPLFRYLYIVHNHENHEPVRMHQAMTKTYARNSSTQIKYIQRAVEMDFVYISNSPKDKRVKYVRPTPRMLELVERELTKELDDRREVVGQLVLLETPPKE